MVKPFAVVKFPEEKDSLAAVPVGWLSEDELFCTWPMHVKGCQLISLVEAQAPPGVVGKGWEVFPVIVIKTYWTYKKAAKKVRQYVWTSTVETSDFSANEALPGVEAVVSHPPLRMPSPPALSSRSLVGGQHKTSQAGRRQPQLQPQHSQEENEGVTSASSSHSSAIGYEDDLAETLQAQEVNQPQDNQEASEDPSRVQLKMIHLLVEIRQQNRDILHQFSQLRQDVLDISERVALLEAPAAQAARAPQVLPLILPRLPAESLQELEAAEAAVKEKGVAKALVVIAFYILGKVERVQPLARSLPVCIVSERGCWQKPLALYLQRHLSSIDLPHPYRVRDSLEVIDYLTTKHADHDLNLFSLDIKDMYYNLDLKIILISVSEAIEMHGVTRFQNASGIPTGGFLDLLRLYLISSLVEYEGEIFIQRSGVCIGSCLAPILSEIFLFFVDRAVQEDLARSGSGCRIFRFVDDYLVVHPSSTSDVSLRLAFAANAGGLSFTKEDASQEGLQFLDLRLTPSSHGLCWSFQQRSQKPVLPFASHHSKTVKSGIVKSLLSSSCKKSCPHLITESLSRQTARLQGQDNPRI
ncbi:uncharacterized protein ISCGN_022439 [Ixodes scapularis]